MATKATKSSKQVRGDIRAVRRWMMTLITRGGEGQEDKNKDRKATKAKAGAWKRVLLARSCARVGGKDVVGEVKGIEMVGVLVAGRGARERGGRRLKVEDNSKR